MNALEALTRLIEVGIETIKEDGVMILAGGEPELEELKTAVSVCQAILNTAIPIARFRMHIAMPESMPDFTVSSPSTKALVEVLRLIREKQKNQLINASLWEQHQSHAEMLHGFEGNTRAQGFKFWIEQVKASEDGTQVQFIPEAAANPGAESPQIESSSGGEEGVEESGSGGEQASRH